MSRKKRDHPKRPVHQLSNPTEIVSDELIKTIEWRKEMQKRIKRLRDLEGPQEIIEHYEFLSSMTYSEKERFLAKEQEESDRYYASIRQKPDEKVAKLIWEKFDLWLEKYKNNLDVLEEEYVTGHYFRDAWFWGDIAVHAEKPFYEHILNEIDSRTERYSGVFKVCYDRIYEILKEHDEQTNTKTC